MNLKKKTKQNKQSENIECGKFIIMGFHMVSFSALRHLEEAVKLQIKVLDTPEELIITHQAMADVLRGLGRKEDAEKEMERAAKWVKRLGPLKVPFD